MRTSDGIVFFGAAPSTSAPVTVLDACGVDGAWSLFGGPIIGNSELSLGTCVVLSDGTNQATFRLVASVRSACERGDDAAHEFANAVYAHLEEKRMANRRLIMVVAELDQ